MQSPIFQRLVEEIKAKACFRPERVRDGRLDQRYRQRSIVHTHKHTHVLNISTLVIVFCNLKSKRSRSSRNQPVKVITNHRVLDIGREATKDDVQRTKCNLQRVSRCLFLILLELSLCVRRTFGFYCRSFGFRCRSFLAVAVRLQCFNIRRHQQTSENNGVLCCGSLGSDFKKKKRKGKPRREEECGGA